MLQLWRSAQELMIEQKQRDACTELFPAVSEALDYIAPDAPSSYACKCTMSIISQSDIDYQDLLHNPHLLYAEVEHWLNRSTGDMPPTSIPLAGLIGTSCVSDLKATANGIRLCAQSHGQI